MASGVDNSRLQFGFLDKMLKLAPVRDPPPVSVILFGSAARATAADRIGDTDLIIVIPDQTPAEHRRGIRVGRDGRIT